MTSLPLTFVIIVNWNGREVTLDCLDSFRKVSYSPLKIVVVDNGSTDGSVQAIRAQYPDVIVLEMHTNLLFAGGTNAGIRYGLEHGGALFVVL